MLGKLIAFLRRLFRKRLPYDPQARHPMWPTRDEIEALPPFEAMDLDDIVEVVTPEGALRARDEIMNAHVVGFDTESKPTFVKGQVSTGPHVVQFSTLERAYIFLLHHDSSRKVVRELITSRALMKVGFGLNDDLRRIPIKLGVQPHNVLDLESMMRDKGYGRGAGAKVAVAMVLKRRFQKSKKAGTSNWMSRELTDKQLLYAANDAYAAIRVYEALKKKG